MKGQPHLIISLQPLNWLLVPPVLYGECEAEVIDPEPIDTWADGKLPEFDPFRLCPKCLARLQVKSQFAAQDEWGEPAKRWIYAIASKRHRGETISKLGETVERVSG